MAAECRHGILPCCQALAALGYFDRMPTRRPTVSRRECDNDQQQPGLLALASRLLVVPAEHARCARRCCFAVVDDAREKGPALLLS